MIRHYRRSRKTIVMFGGEELGVDRFPPLGAQHHNHNFTRRLLLWKMLARAKAHEVNMDRFKRGLRWVRRGDRLLLEPKAKEVGCQTDQAA